MANTGSTIKCEAIREIAYGSITSSYQALGGPLTRGALRLTITNNTDVDLYLSVDGSTDHKKLPAYTARIYDNKTNDMRELVDQQYYIKYGTAPSAGWAALEVEYV